MSMDHRNECLIERLPAGRLVEFVSFYWPTPDLAAADWPITPGGVRHDTSGQPALLHFAPGRWLAPNPDPDLVALLDHAARDGAGTLIEATGKWEPLTISGSGAGRLLASTLEVASVLAGRGCAAVTLFDCPAIIASADQGFALWIQASYAAHFSDTAERCSKALYPAR